MSFPQTVHQSSNNLLIQSLISGSSNFFFDQKSMSKVFDMSKAATKHVSKMPNVLSKSVATAAGGGGSHANKRVRVMGAGAHKETFAHNMISPPGTIPPITNTNHLPQCRVRRTYTCVHCKLLTQNPRDHLYHLRDVHNERVRIFECTDCIYASKQFQKLVRHKKMVHGALEFHDNSSNNSNGRNARKTITLLPKKPSNSKDESSAQQSLPTITDARILVKLKNYPQIQPKLSIEPPLSHFIAESDPLADDDHQLYINDRPEPSHFQCRLCSFRCDSKSQLETHEKDDHAKAKFFRCVKCSYLTHIKARFTKHVKYHSMPMIKCEMCDFRTPYKWNLDRHSKNHNGNGVFKCSICNFTADIKQSLTVHETNHHNPPDGLLPFNGSRKRNRVGGSDSLNSEEIIIDAAGDVDYDSLSEQMPGVLMHGVKRKLNVDYFNDDDGMEDEEEEEAEVEAEADDSMVDGGHERRKRSTNSYSLSEESDEFAMRSPPSPPQYLQNQCQFCDFKTAWNTEMIQHEVERHNYNRNERGDQRKKTKKPLPNLIPIDFRQNGTDAKREQDEIEDNDRSQLGQCFKIDFSSLITKSIMEDSLSSDKPPSIQLQNKFNAIEKDKGKRFVCDKCGYSTMNSMDFESHQEGCYENDDDVSITATRCPYCRLRFNTSLELRVHLNKCSIMNELLEKAVKVEQKTPNLSDNNNTSCDLSSANEKNLELRYSQSEEIEIQPEIDTVALSYRFSNEDEENEVSRTDNEDTMLENEPEASDNDQENGKAEEDEDSDENYENEWNRNGDTKQVFQCPYCDYQSEIVSQFHVHFIGHSDRKPFECSICQYRSVWRWDIVKHIRIKCSKDPNHDYAKVITIDETGRRNYSKYNQYLIQQDDESDDQKSQQRQLQQSRDDQLDEDPQRQQFDSFYENDNDNNGSRNETKFENPYSKLSITQMPTILNLTNNNTSIKSLTATQKFFKCKRCGYTNSNRESMVTHIRLLHNKNSTIQQVSILNDNDEHAYTKERGQFRCAHCNQISNWKHVIQRHCRLKHNGDIKVIIINKYGVEKLETEEVEDDQSWPNDTSNGLTNDHQQQLKKTSNQLTMNNNRKIGGNSGGSGGGGGDQSENIFKCSQCEYFSESFREYAMHLQKHSTQEKLKAIGGENRYQMILKCRYCKSKFEDQRDLAEHIVQNHKNIKNVTTSLKNSNYFECHVCDFQTSHKEEYLSHAEQCHNEERQSAEDSDDVEMDAEMDAEIEPEVSLKIELDDEIEAEADADANADADAEIENEGDEKAEMEVGAEVEVESDDDETEAEGEMAEAEAETSGSDNKNNRKVIGRRSRVNYSSFGDDLTSIGGGVVLDTKDLPDIPLVWVSRMGDFVKMYKCRYCPHVNFRKININDHEKMHKQRETDPKKPNDVMHYCTDCSYVCNNAGVLSSHSKVHRGFFGDIHGLVDFRKSDEEQIRTLMNVIESTNSNRKTKQNDLCCDLKQIAYEFVGDNFPRNDDQHPHNNHQQSVTNEIDTDKQLLSFCSHCPARFLQESDIANHTRFHVHKFVHRCVCCSYSAKQKPHILAHQKVHLKEYQNRTNILLRSFRINDKFMPPKLVTITKESDDNTRLLWIAASSADSKKLGTKSTSLASKNSHRYQCSKCPAQFFKQEAFMYHCNLHGQNTPFKCSFCDYAAKNSISLEQHLNLHSAFSATATTDESDFVREDESADQSEHQNSDEQADDDEESPLQQHHMISSQQHYGGQRISQVPQMQNFDPQFGTLINGNPNFIYPTCLKKGKLKEKRYKCHKCPSAFEKREQYRVHSTLHGSKQKYTCEHCDYSVKYYANFTQHVKKHELHNEALAIQRLSADSSDASEQQQSSGHLNSEVSDWLQSIAEYERKDSFAQNSYLSSSPSLSSAISFNSVDLKKFHTCQLCPYTNYRKDAVDSHQKRHISVSGVRHNHVCSFCDYTVPQAHFLREHEKLHMDPMSMDSDANSSIETGGDFLFKQQKQVQTRYDNDNNDPESDRSMCLEIEEKIFEKFAEKKDH